MTHVKLDPSHIKIEDKVNIVPYKTIVFSHWAQNNDQLTEEEYQMLAAAFRIGIMFTLAECIDPASIASHGDEQLKKNYHTIVRLAEKLGVIEAYNIPEDYTPYEESSDD